MNEYTKGGSCLKYFQRIWRIYILCFIINKQTQNQNITINNTQYEATDATASEKNSDVSVHYY